MHSRECIGRANGPLPLSAATSFSAVPRASPPPSSDERPIRVSGISSTCGAYWHAGLYDSAPTGLSANAIKKGSSKLAYSTTKVGSLCSPHYGHGLLGSGGILVKKAECSDFELLSSHAQCAKEQEISRTWRISIAL